MAASGTDHKPVKGYARFIGDVPGCFVLLDRGDSADMPQTHPFSARSVSTSKAVITADTPVELGEAVALRFEGIGIRRGVVERVMKGGFIVGFAEAAREGEGVDARIDWLNKKTRGRAADRRAHKRVIPRNVHARLILGAENMIACTIKDMSASGAAILAPVQPAIGSLLAVGAVPGRVVRHFDGGFAIRFLVLQDLAELEGLLTLSTDRQKKLAAKKLGFAA